MNPAFFVGLQYLLPQHFLSRVVRLATHCRCRRWKDLLIGSFVKHYPVEMAEAAQPDPHAFDSFNAFFTRELRAGARPLDTAATAIVSPVDGTVSEAGRIEGDRLIQAKGHGYTLRALLGGKESLARHFQDGEFATLYLAPHNYHRIHMPFDGRLVETLYVPGKLFSVNTATAQRVPELFARNERVVCIFENDTIGRFAIVLVGALFVGGMSTVWAENITPARRRAVTSIRSPRRELPKGAEMGRFNMGSTVVLLFERGKLHWHNSLTAGTPITMGKAIGDLRSN